MMASTASSSTSIFRHVGSVLMRGAPVEALQRVPLFADLSKREVQKIARLFKKRRFSKGETIVKEGSGGAAFFVIESGEAAVFIGGKQRTTLKPGDYFCEIAHIDEGTTWRRSPPPANSLVMGLPTGTSALSWRERRGRLETAATDGDAATRYAGRGP
jgi:signal-transduction protein with cAMP-binding, CBS, and nucleotidyltransferase domain